jgi:hypothetical protein
MKMECALSLFDLFRRSKSATTAEEDRPLSEAERTLAVRLLREFAPPEAIAFLPQLDQARVTGKCSCGCPTVDLTVPAELRVADPPVNRPLADAFGRVDGKQVGVMLFQADGLLCLLEIYALDDFEDNAFGLPAATTLQPALWDGTTRDQNKG